MQTTDRPVAENTSAVKNAGSYLRVHIDWANVSSVGQAGGLRLVETIRATGLERALSAQLSGWHKPIAVHNLGTIICGLARDVGRPAV